jgi:homoserine dehydrogenase
MKEVRLILAGFGNVGQALARLLISKEDHLRQMYGLELRVVAIATGSHGIVHNAQGIDLAKALDAGDLTALSTVDSYSDSRALLKEVEAEVLVESIPVDYASGQPAIEYLSTAVERGMHAVTANKGPVVYGLDVLRELASENGRRFYFESAVMDGAPVFSMWRECLPCAKLVSFRGILNSTTNYVLTRMEQGKSQAEAVREAQQIGVAETDPSGDLEGWDAAVKVAALVAVLMEIDLGIDGVDRKGIEDLALEDIQAVEQGQRWKLVCSAAHDGAEVRAKVAPKLIGIEDPLYNVMGTTSAVTFESDVLGPLTLVENNPGPDTTAYGLMADVLNAVQER